MPEPDEDRSALATALEWASIVLTISMEMVVPGLIGYWLDLRLGTVVLFMLCGFAGGITLAVWHLVRLTRKPDPSTPPDGRRKR